MSERNKIEALQGFDEQILRHTAAKFVVAMFKESLCEWIERFPHFELPAQEIRDTSALLIHIVQGRARSTKERLIIIQGGRKDARRRSTKARGPGAFE